MRLSALDGAGHGSVPQDATEGGSGVPTSFPRSSLPERPVARFSGLPSSRCDAVMGSRGIHSLSATGSREPGTSLNLGFYHCEVIPSAHTLQGFGHAR